VTGASSGIGACFARALAARGYDLLLVARRRERLVALAKELAAAHGVEADVEAADLADAEGLARVASVLRERAPELLVNSAGFGTVGAFAQSDVERELEEMRLNVVAPVVLARAALPAMLEAARRAKRSGAGGSRRRGVINVSSLAGEGPSPYTATYGATKAFLTRFSESVHEELRGSGVSVMALAPGFTRTGFQEAAGVDPNAMPQIAWMTPEFVVEAALAAWDRGDAVCIPGVANRAVAVVESLLPRSLLRRLAGAALGRAVGR
jgi:hypothetical protein